MTIKFLENSLILLRLVELFQAGSFSPGLTSPVTEAMAFWVLCLMPLVSLSLLKTWSSWASVFVLLLSFPSLTCVCWSILSRWLRRICFPSPEFSVQLFSCTIAFEFFMVCFLRCLTLSLQSGETYGFNCLFFFILAWLTCAACCLISENHYFIYFVHAFDTKRLENKYDSSYTIIAESKSSLYSCNKLNPS